MQMLSFQLFLAFIVWPQADKEAILRHCIVHTYSTQYVNIDAFYVLFWPKSKLVLWGAGCSQSIFVPDEVIYAGCI